MIRKAVSWLVFVIVLGVAWLFVGPVPFGGPVHYVIVDGTSMEPTYHDGDLVLAREAPRYEVDDVVTYVPDLGGTVYPVIHRIVEVTPEGYVTQGDNREQVDGWVATDDNIAGASWLHVPRAGSAFEYLSRPTSLAGLAAGVVVFQLLKRRERRRDPGDPDPGEDDQDEDAGDSGDSESAASRPQRAAVVVAGGVCVALVAAGTAVGIGFASALTVNGGVIQGFSFPVNIPPPAPESAVLPPLDTEPLDTEPLDPEPLDPEPLDPEPLDPPPLDPPPLDPPPVDEDLGESGGES